MVYADPPGGLARWTVRLIAEEAVKRKLVPAVGRATIRLLLLNHDLKPWREKKLVYRGEVRICQQIIHAVGPGARITLARSGSIRFR
jgi:hypothetical protein